MKSCIVLFIIATSSVYAQFAGPARSVPYEPTSSVNQTHLETLLTAAAPPLTIKPDDVLAIQVYPTNINLQVRVERDGSIFLPLLGKTFVAGMTVAQMQSNLTASLVSGGYVKEPEVTATAVSQPSAVVVVAGELNRPGTFPAFGTHTLIDYISQALGLKDTASYQVTLIRPGMSEPINIPLGPDPKASPYGSIPIFAGDEIRVPVSGVFYAFGALKNQGPFPLKASAPTTVFQALAVAGGIGFQAKGGSAYLVRTQNGERVVVPLNITRIISTKSADVTLQPDDILYVPTNSVKAAIKGGGAGLIVSITNALLYSH